MAYLNEIFVFLLGACIGSFLNVCIYRLPREESVVYKPSHCPGCGNKLGVLDLVPILSYVFLRGRCRHCGSQISAQYPLVELITALLFLAAYITWGISWHTASMWVFLAVLVSVSVVDIHHRIIPDEILVVGTILGLPLIFLTSISDLISGLIGFFAAGLLLLAIAVVSKGGMGGGDIKLSAVMGLFLGWQGVAVALFLSFLIGGIAGILLLVTKIKGRKDAVPFGPYLALGALVAVFYGQRIITWYMSLSGL
ncbi:MAG: peptidase A24 [Peptococcaceae bacterium BRH_c8a]|nr:MAG: peptidase A24 [Peptococcaceae bacterium BRH_c8a]